MARSRYIAVKRLALVKLPYSRGPKLSFFICSESLTVLHGAAKHIEALARKAQEEQMQQLTADEQRNICFEWQRTGRCRRNGCRCLWQSVLIGFSLWLSKWKQNVVAVGTQCSAVGRCSTYDISSLIFGGVA